MIRQTILFVVVGVVVLLLSLLLSASCSFDQAHERLFKTQLGIAISGSSDPIVVVVVVLLLSLLSSASCVFDQAHAKLFETDQESLIRELTDLPRLSATRKINQLIKRTNSVRAHACVLR